jgi:hypothetical protein
MDPLGPILARSSTLLPGRGATEPAPEAMCSSYRIKLGLCRQRLRPQTCGRRGFGGHPARSGAPAPCAPARRCCPAGNERGSKWRVQKMFRFPGST